MPQDTTILRQIYDYANRANPYPRRHRAFRDEEPGSDLLAGQPPAGSRPVVERFLNGRPA